MPEITKAYIKGKSTTNTIVYVEQEDSLPKFAPTVYIRKEVLPTAPESMEITYKLPDQA